MLFDSMYVRQGAVSRTWSRFIAKRLPHTRADAKSLTSLAFTTCNTHGLGAAGMTTEMANDGLPLKAVQASPAAAELDNEYIHR
jgi:hypothetical protein